MTWLISKEQISVCDQPHTHAHIQTHTHTHLTFISRWWMEVVKDSALDNVANFLLPWLSNSNRYFSELSIHHLGHCPLNWQSWAQRPRPFTHVHRHTHGYMHTDIHAVTCTRTYTRLHAHGHTRGYMHTDIHTVTCTRTYTRLHAHGHTQPDASRRIKTDIGCGSLQVSDTWGLWIIAGLVYFITIHWSKRAVAAEVLIAKYCSNVRVIHESFSFKGKIILTTNQMLKLPFCTVLVWGTVHSNSLYRPQNYSHQAVNL